MDCHRVKYLSKSTFEETHVHELIYRFLLEAGFTRASLISLSEPAGALPDAQSTASPSSAAESIGDQVSTHKVADSTEKYRRFFQTRRLESNAESNSSKLLPTTEPTAAKPAYLVIDPATADLLAVIAVSEGDAETELTRQHVAASRYAAQSGDEHTQVYLIQLLSGATKDAERVHFYHAPSADQRQSVSAYAFPDLDTLQTRRIRAQALQHSKAADMPTEPVSYNRASGVGRVYFLAVLLLILGAADWWWQQNHGAELFSIVQTLLIITAAVFFVAPALSLRYRPSNKPR